MTSHPNPQDNRRMQHDHETPAMTEKPRRIKPGLISNIFWGVAMVFALVIIGRALFLASPAPTPILLDDNLSLVDASSQAAQENKLVVAVVTADWCGPCQHYKRGALADTEVNNWLNEHAVGVSINAETRQQDVANLQVQAFPTTYVLSSSGEVIAAKMGNIRADDLLDLLEGAKQRAGTAVATD